MRDDWEHIFSKFISKRLPRKTMKELSGYHPSDEKHRIEFAKRIGITPAQTGSA